MSRYIEYIIIGKTELGSMFAYKADGEIYILKGKRVAESRLKHLRETFINTQYNYITYELFKWLNLQQIVDLNYSE